MAEVRQGTSRRDFLKLAATAVAGAALEACGPAAPPAGREAVVTTGGQPSAGATTSSAQTTQPTPAKAAVQLQWWINWGGDGGEACKQVAAVFAERNPGISINVLPGLGGALVEKTLAAIAAGEPPDVFNSHESEPTFASRGALVALDDYIASSASIELDNYRPEMYNTLKWCGKTYGVPAVAGDLWTGLMYNKRLFKEAGLDPDKPPTTPEELRAMSDEITHFDQAGNIEILGFDPLDSMACVPFTWAAAFDTTWLTPDLAPKLNSPEQIAVADYIGGFHRKYGAEKLGAFVKTFGQWMTPQSGFIQEKQAMVLIGSWAPGSLAKGGSEQLKEQTAVTWWPNKSGKKLQTGTFIGVCMTQGSKHKDEAWRFMEYLTTDEVSDVMFKKAGLMTWSKSYARKAAPEFTQLPGMAWFANSLTEADKFYEHQVHPMNNEIIQKWQTAIGEVNFGRLSAEEAMNKLQADLEKSYAPMAGKLCPA